MTPSAQFRLHPLDSYENFAFWMMAIPEQRLFLWKRWTNVTNPWLRRIQGLDALNG
jgi:hypothetical protein